MSASPIITLGYGSTFGLPALIITLGYGLGSAPPSTPADTHDLPRRTTKQYEEQQRKRQKALEARQDRKREEAEALRRQIDEARGFAPAITEISQDAEQEQIPENVQKQPYIDRMPMLLEQLVAARQQIDAMEKQRQMILRKIRQRREDEEIQIILRAIHPFA